MHIFITCCHSFDIHVDLPFIPCWGILHLMVLYLFVPHVFTKFSLKKRGCSTRFYHIIFVLCLSRDIKTHSSVPLSVCHKNFNLAHIFWSINDRALIFGMHDPCVKPFQLTPCQDLDLWPTSRSKLLPGGGPQFSEFAYSISKYYLYDKFQKKRKNYNQPARIHMPVILYMYLF